MKAPLTSRVWLGVCAGFLAGVCGTATYFDVIWPKDRGVGHHEVVPRGRPSAAAVEPERVSRLGRDEIRVPAHVAAKMKLRTATVASAKDPISLPGFQGVLALNNDHLSRVHSRFAGEVVELGRSTDGSDPTLRVGDRVQQGDLLAVIWSTDLGQKKSELVDALAKLRAEEQLRDRLKKLFNEGAGAGRTYRDAEKDVLARRVEIASLERTLRTWRVTEEDIKDVHQEVEHLGNEETPSVKPGDWARIEVRAPTGGVILEKNVIVGDIVDTATDLFKVGDLSQLVVWAHVYEEDLALLETLPHPIPWMLHLPSRPSVEFAGTLDKVGSVIDPAQHTALLTGKVENPAGQLKVGQFVTASITLPPPKGEVEVPATAVIEDGRESVVFVQEDPSGANFARRPVDIVRRLRDIVYVKGGESPGVRPGDRVVTSGALLLQNAIAQLPVPASPAPHVSVSLRGEPPRGQGGGR
jgi:cobalt-zinc-cadmium efflux system membrane fusion protein